MNNKKRNASKLMSIDYEEFIKFSNKLINGKGIKAYIVSNGQTSKMWRFGKINRA